MTKKYYEPQYGSPEYDMESHLEARKGERKALQRLKNDRTRARVVSQARKVQDKVKISPKSIKPNVTYRTQGKQDLLEGKPRKTTVSAKAGAGLQHIKAQFQRYGAKQWWKSKSH